MNPLFLDVETTGTRDSDRLCQLAYKFDGQDGDVALFKPPVPMSIDAMAVCHITNEMLADCQSFEESLTKEVLQAHFDDPKTVFVAHNAKFDMGFLLKEGMELPKQHICTFKLSHAFDKKAELEKNTLQYLRYYYGLKFKQEINPHDALSDVIVLEGLFKFYLQHFTLEEMVEISKQPILHKKFTFGKYKGELYKDVAVKDLQYLMWLRREAKELDENIKHTLEYHINNR